MAGEPVASEHLRDESHSGGSSAVATTDIEVYVDGGQVAAPATPKPKSTRAKTPRNEFMSLCLRGKEKGGMELTMKKCSTMWKEKKGPAAAPAAPARLAPAMNGQGELPRPQPSPKQTILVPIPPNLPMRVMQCLPRDILGEILAGLRELERQSPKDLEVQSAIRALGSLPACKPGEDPLVGRPAPPPRGRQPQGVSGVAL